MPRRYVAAIAAIAAVILIIDVAFLVTGVHRIRREHADAVEVLEKLEPRLTERSKTIRDLHAQSDVQREAVFAFINLMTDIYDLGRKADGIEQAHQKWAGATEALNKAKASNSVLPEMTTDLLTQLRRQNADATRLLRLVEEPREVSYTKAVVTAYSSMTSTHEIYAKMNGKLNDGMKLYEDLFMRTSDFLTKEKSKFFRTRREAADYYTLDTEKGGLGEALEKFSEELATLQQEAAGAVERTAVAFGVVERSKKNIP